MGVVRIRKTEMKHESGTKRYAVILLHDESSDISVVVTNWGRMHVRGQCKVQQFRPGYFNVARTEARKAIQNKGARGYSEEHTDEVSVPDTKGGLNSYLRLNGDHMRQITEALNIGDSLVTEVLEGPEVMKVETRQHRVPDKPEAPRPAIWGTW